MAQRHTGPWPARNDERGVALWLVDAIGGEEAGATTRWLLDHVTGVDRGRRLAGYAYSESELNELARLAQECVAGKPVQHVVGWTEFMGLRLKVDGRALVPRPETEELAAEAIRWAKVNGVERVCDAGTGSGCLALALKAALAQAEVHAIDASSAALKLAQENAVETRQSIHFHHLAFQDLAQLVPPAFDLIVSNPPYIPHIERKGMDAVVVDYDPPEALFVPDEDPLVHYRTLAAACREQGALRPGGLFACEVHERWAHEVAKLFNGWDGVRVLTDLQGRPRMVRGQLPLSR
jgi:release factor glutamine methyltransferase